MSIFIVTIPVLAGINSSPISCLGRILILIPAQTRNGTIKMYTNYKTSLLGDD